MARKFIQSSVACDSQGVVYVGVCEDGSMWCSDNGKPWIRLDSIPEDAPNTKEENSDNTQQLKAAIALLKGVSSMLDGGNSPMVGGATHQNINGWLARHTAV